MLKQLLILTLLLCNALTLLHAQSTVAGSIKDSRSEEALPFATVELISMGDESIRFGVLTNAEGIYYIQKIPKGTYTIRISFMGYEPFQSTLELENKKYKYDYTLNLLTYNLTEVEISAERKEVEKNIEKTVVNVSKNATLTGGTAMDVMKSLPSVDIDVDGNISYRGSDKVVILVNGEQSGLVKSLDQINVNQIERVEIINNPSAKYDSEGTSGIINLVLKKAIEGKNKTTFTVKGGYPETLGGSIGYSGSGTKTSFFINAGGNHNTKFQTKEHLRKNYEDLSAFHYYQYDRMDDTRNHAFVNTGVDYKLKPGQKLGMTLMATKKWNQADRSIHYQTQKQDYSAFNDSYKDIFIGLDNVSIDGKLNYSIKLNEKGSTLKAQVIYSLFEQDQNMENTYYPLENYSEPALQNTLAEQLNKKAGTKLDYFLPVNDSLSIESGYHLNFSDVTNIFSSDSYNYILQFWHSDSALENEFNYVQQVQAGYLDINKKYKNLELQAGVRIEHTQTTQNETKKDSYLNLFPSLTISRKIDERHSIYTSLNRRINRPTLKMLNPYTSEYADLLNMHKGNPDLLPEYVNSGELGARFIYKKFSGMISGYYKYIQQAVSRVKTAYNDSALMVTFINLDQAQMTGGELYLSYKLTKWWTLNGSFNTFHTYLQGYYEYNLINKTRTAWNTNLSSRFKLPWKMSLQLDGYYRSKLPSVMGTYMERYYMDLGLSKKILKNKGRLVLKITDVFNTYRFGLDLDAMNEYGFRYSQRNRRKNESQYFVLNFIYNIEGKDSSKKTGKTNFFLESFDK